MLFISWAPFCSRSDNIARHLGGKSFMVYSPRFGSNYFTVAFKYVSQTFKTLRILFREKPGAVFVMTPPVFASLPAWIYSRVTGTPFLIDAHSGAFVDPRWKPLLFIHKWFSAAARATIVTNEYMLTKLREDWNCAAIIVRDVPVRFAEPVRPRLEGACNMTLVATFTRDEPIELFFRAAAQLPQVSFHVTSDYRRADPRVLEAKPRNVRLTGFLPDKDYVGLLLASDAVISLTTLDHTMQRGAYEAVYLGKPVVTSNTEVLKNSFTKGAVHVDCTVDSIVEGILKMQTNLKNYQDEVRQLRQEKLNKWEAVENELRLLIWQDAN